MGREIAGRMLGAAPLVNDAALQAYVNRVGRWVAPQSERPDLPLAFRRDRHRDRSMRSPRPAATC